MSPPPDHLVEVALVTTGRNRRLRIARDPLRGLYISDADVDALLASGGPAAHARLSALAYLFDLDPLETEIVLICLAPDIDLRYERLYGYLQDDVTRRRPTTDLVAKLLGDGTPASSANVRALLTPSARLMQNTLLSEPAEDTAERSLLARPLRLEERVVESSSLAFRVAFSVLRHREDAEDVAQEAFAKAYRSFHQLRERDRFRAFQVGIAGGDISNESPLAPDFQPREKLVDSILHFAKVFRSHSGN